MKKRPTTSYSHLTILRVAFEYELNNVLKFEDKQKVFGVVNYLQQRLEQIREDEKQCLKIQSLLKR